MRHISAACMIAAAAVTLAGVVSACAGDTPKSTDAVGPATEYAEDVSSGVDGAAVYQARCASCHGVDLRGTEKGPSQLSIVYEPNHHSDGAYRIAIRSGSPQHHWGFGDMDPVPDITDAEVEAVITFIRGEQQRFGFER